MSHKKIEEMRGYLNADSPEERATRSLDIPENAPGIGYMRDLFKKQLNEAQRGLNQGNISYKVLRELIGSHKRDLEEGRKEDAYFEVHKGPFHLYFSPEDFNSLLKDDGEIVSFLKDIDISEITLLNSINLIETFKDDMYPRLKEVLSEIGVQDLNFDKFLNFELLKTWGVRLLDVSEIPERDVVFSREIHTMALVISHAPDLHVNFSYEMGQKYYNFIESIPKNMIWYMDQDSFNFMNSGSLDIDVDFDRIYADPLTLLDDHGINLNSELACLYLNNINNENLYLKGNKNKIELRSDISVPYFEFINKQDTPLTIQGKILQPGEKIGVERKQGERSLMFKDIESSSDPLMLDPLEQIVSDIDGLYFNDEGVICGFLPQHYSIDYVRTLIEEGVDVSNVTFELCMGDPGVGYLIADLYDRDYRVNLVTPFLTTNLNVLRPFGVLEQQLTQNDEFILNADLENEEVNQEILREISNISQNTEIVSTICFNEFFFGDVDNLRFIGVSSLILSECEFDDDDVFVDFVRSFPDLKSLSLDRCGYDLELVEEIFDREGICLEELQARE